MFSNRHLKRMFNHMEMSFEQNESISNTYLLIKINEKKVFFSSLSFALVLDQVDHQNVIQHIKSMIV
jgi:hypothetical protein